MVKKLGVFEEVTLEVADPAAKQAHGVFSLSLWERAGMRAALLAKMKKND